jgi:ferredoxin
MGVGWHIRWDPIKCGAHGYCAEILPERIKLDDWGFPIIDHEPIGPDLEDHARRAVDACPLLALKLERESDKPEKHEKTGKAA